MQNDKLDEFLIASGVENANELNTKEQLKILRELLSKIEVEIDYNDYLNSKDKLEKKEYITQLRKYQQYKLKTLGYLYEVKDEYKKEKKAKRKQLIRGIINGKK